MRTPAALTTLLSRMLRPPQPSSCETVTGASDRAVSPSSSPGRAVTVAACPRCMLTIDPAWAFPSTCRVTVRSGVRPVERVDVVTDASRVAAGPRRRPDRRRRRLCAGRRTDAPWAWSARSSTLAASVTSVRAVDEDNVRMGRCVYVWLPSSCPLSRISRAIAGSATSQLPTAKTGHVDLGRRQLGQHGLGQRDGAGAHGRSAPPWAGCADRTKRRTGRHPEATRRAGRVEAMSTAGRSRIADIAPSRP